MKCSLFQTELHVQRGRWSYSSGSSLISHCTICKSRTVWKSMIEYMVFCLLPPPPRRPNYLTGEGGEVQVVASTPCKQLGTTPLSICVEESPTPHSVSSNLGVLVKVSGVDGK